MRSVNVSGKVGVLFLAHDGVANPDLWLSWRASEAEHEPSLLFFVLRNEEVRYKSRFADDFDTGIRVPTEWGHRSLVDACTEGFRHCFAADDAIEQVFLVCGTSVPLQSPSFLFRPSRSAAGDTFVPFSSNVQLSCDGAMTVGEDRFRFHSQFIALTREHSEHLQNHLAELDRLLNLVVSVGRGPDEWVFSRYFEMYGLANMDYPAMDRAMPSWTAPHPLTWRDLEKPRAFCWDDGPTIRASLLPVLHAARIHGALFFRKVGPIPGLRFPDVCSEPPVVRVGSVRVKRVTGADGREP